MHKNKFISFGRPYLGSDELKSVKKVIDSTWLGTGEITNQFEKKFAKYKITKFAVSLNSYCRTSSSILSLNLKKNDEIITTPMTFASTINSLAGAKPILADAIASISILKL